MPVQDGSGGQGIETGFQPDAQVSASVPPASAPAHVHTLYDSLSIHTFLFKNFQWLPVSFWKHDIFILMNQESDSQKRNLSPGMRLVNGLSLGISGFMSHSELAGLCFLPLG